MNSESRMEILGTGVALPHLKVMSTEIDKHQGLKRGTTFDKTGVFSRHYVSNESASEMAVTAIEIALENSDVDLDNIDCLIAACGTAEQSIPYNAAKIHAQLNPSRPIPAFDINMTCLSTLKALEIASYMIASGAYRRVLIVSSDIASVGLDWNCVQTAGLFGDGAAALVVQSSNGKRGFKAFNFETHSKGVNLCQVRGGGSLNHPANVSDDYLKYGRFEMEGKELYKLTFKIIGGFIEETLKKNSIGLKDIDWVIPHQASSLAISHLQKKLKLPSSKVVNILRERGNQIAASIPSAYHAFRESHQAKEGDLILFIGTSAGLSLGAAVMEV